MVMGLLGGVPPPRPPCFFTGGRAAPQTPLLFNWGACRSPDPPAFFSGTAGGGLRSSTQHIRLWRAQGGGKKKIP